MNTVTSHAGDNDSHLEELVCTPEVAVGLRAVHVLPAAAVDGQQEALEAVAGVGEARQPSQVDGNRVQGDEETREQDDRNHGHRA